MYLPCTVYIERTFLVKEACWYIFVPHIISTYNLIDWQRQREDLHFIQHPEVPRELLYSVLHHFVSTSPWKIQLMYHITGFSFQHEINFSKIIYFPCLVKLVKRSPGSIDYNSTMISLPFSGHFYAECDISGNRARVNCSQRTAR